MLVDVSSMLVHLAFHSQVAYLRISKRMPEGCDVAAIIDEPVFRERYQRKVRDILLTDVPRIVRGRFGKAARARVVLAYDCMREATWRRAAFPAYKEQRAHKRQAFDTRVYAFLDEQVLPAVEEEAGVVYPKLRVDTAEADDIIATVALREHASQRVLVLSTDTDYAQLPVSVFDVRGSKGTDVRGALCTKLGLDADSPDANKTLLACKVIDGDKADNIPCIYEGLGKVVCPRPKTMALATDAAALEAALSAHEVLRQRYERNMDLIDMTRIPQAIQSSIIDLWVAAC